MLFFRQLGALFVKNWIVLAKHPLVNLLRCLIMPVACGIFLAYAQVFLAKPQNNGLGSMIPIHPLVEVFEGSLQLIWSDDTGGAGVLKPEDIMSRVTRGFSSKQLKAVHKVDSDDIADVCQQNYNGVSDCFASITFNTAPEPGSNAPFNYTITVDQNINFVDTKHHSGDTEVRLLPLQWAIESAIMELDTNVTPATPLEWPFTEDTNAEEIIGIRLGYVSFVSSLLVIVFAVCYIGISYHLPGTAVAERASGLTGHMKAMGLLDSARVISWHLSLSLAYLPAWIIIAVIWQVKVFSGTSVGYMIIIHLLFGLCLASWSLFIMAPFGKSPQLAAIVSTAAALAAVGAGMAVSSITTWTAFIISIFFPPFFYPIAIKCISDFEVNRIPTSATALDPESADNLILWPLLLAAAITVFLWPVVGVLWEHWLYDPRNSSDGAGCCGRRQKNGNPDKHVVPPDTAISVRNLGKDFRTSWFKGKKGIVTAISDLSLDVPKHGIFVLLGPNGAGKSTAMSILGGLMGRTRGSVLFEGGVEQLPRGSIGLVPQKNVLFPELTCYQTLRLWRAVKPQYDDGSADEDIVQLLRDCDLDSKVHYNAGSLSGGQKRKLQLAIGLVGDSKILLVDECTSGVDPLSRRSIWKILLNAVRDDRTIVLTTHFLDEADLLADEIAVLATPGKLVSHGNPVVLKSTLGEGYTMRVVYSCTSEKVQLIDSEGLLDAIRPLAPQAHVSASGPNELSYHLKTNDPSVVRQVLEVVERMRHALQIESYSVSATSIEDIFLDLMRDEEQKQSEIEKSGEDSASELPEIPATAAPLQLKNGTQRSVLGQAFTIFHKRALILRRSWLAPLIAIAIVLIPSIVTLGYVPKTAQSCIITDTSFPPEAVSLPDALQYVLGGFPDDGILLSPPGLLDAFGNDTTGTLYARNLTENVADNATFIHEITDRFSTLLFGGVSVDLNTGVSLVAWEARGPSTGMFLLNTVSNLLYNRALNDTGRTPAQPKRVNVSLGTFPQKSSGSLDYLQWAAFFAAAVAIYPAFFTLYVAQERRSSVQAMQLSNGLSNPAGLWLGHMFFDSIFSIVVSTILVGVFSAKSTLFVGLGYLWFIMVLHGFTGTLFAYCITIVVNSPLAAFASFAAYQTIIFLLYLAGYLLSLTYGKAVESGHAINAIHFTLSLLSPALNVARAGFVSVNLFSLLCHGDQVVSTSSMGSVTRYGGPILYLILHGILLFFFLIWVDSGSAMRHKLLALHRRREGPSPSTAFPRPDVLSEREALNQSDDALRVLDVSKTFGTNKVVDSVSFGVAQDTIFALLGPNGAGKTTTFNMIRGDLRPDRGDILINGRSIVRHTQGARHSLGVCPQFTAIDAQLTVREHLHVYARLKGLRRGEEVRRDVDALMQATGLDLYADRMANKLSGGNQRKLALAIALIGNPSVVLIDEFSTGIDAKMKRDMWSTLKNLAVGKAIVITTHSMEEASTLANKVGILAKRMLAIGTNESLVERYATYLVHFPCRTRQDLVRAQEIMSHIPGARMADDVATRFEVPISAGEGKPGMSLAELFGILAERGAGEYAVEKASLESVFMKVIRENEVEEGDGEARAVKERWWRV
ncbi:P-loop containing nucleoside triphosphate hydrolase protein [Trametes maxima]|nr:P-loop containing nucleoside triphosphate hydrolase protein [Trametes maxima]